MLWCLALTAAWADPDPDERLYARLARAQELDVVLGGSDRSPTAQAAALGALRVVQDPYWYGQWTRLSARLEPQLLALDGQQPGWLPVVSARSWARVAVGDGRTQGMLGDAEPGLFSPRVGVYTQALSPWFEAKLGLDARVDLGGGVGEITFPIQEAWVGLRHGPVRAGFGLERRALGPGRHGALILWDDAQPWPAGSVAVEGRVPRLGRLRADVGVGWLQAPRGDVDHPGHLWMDLRWAPVPWLELGASRASLFWGEGRPAPSLGQLILPLDPHVPSDPDQLLPDQDEIAALDARLRVPLPGAMDYVEVYWQYGGDDMIVRRFGPVPTPSLAGVANLGGVEWSAGPFSANLEYARLMDDTFRWYTGHRVYHDGFTQEGRPLAHPNGGDAQTWWGRAAVEPGAWGAALWAEQVRRVEVYDVLEQVAIISIQDERRVRGGLEGWWWVGRARLGGGCSLERVTGEDFVPGATDWKPRVWVEISAAPVILGGVPSGL